MVESFQELTILAAKNTEIDCHIADILMGMLGESSVHIETIRIWVIYGRLDKLGSGRNKLICRTVGN